MLVNNAGLELITPILEPGDEVESTLRAHHRDQRDRHLLRDARGREVDGRPAASIVLTASVWGKTGAAEFSAYVTSKHANIGFMRTLAKELGPRGITRQCGLPRMGQDSRRDALARRDVEALRRSRAGSAERASSRRRRWTGLMEPEDVADLYLFLASDAARNITGQAYNVDRGEVLS